MTRLIPAPVPILSNMIIAQAEAYRASACEWFRLTNIRILPYPEVYDELTVKSSARRRAHSRSR